MNSEILVVEDLYTRFITPEGVVHAVNGISFSVGMNETLGIVGESGCGKTVSMLSIMRLLPQPPSKIESNKVRFLGEDLISLPGKRMRSIRGTQIGMIFQDPMTSLNPVLSIGYQLSEKLIDHLKLTKRQATSRAIELLQKVGIPNSKGCLRDYPHQLSGGMRQRVMIAMALACNPRLLIADEPTTALDVTIQAQIINLIKRLKDELKMSIIWITHDLGVVAGLADSVVVMYAGFIVESAKVEDLYSNPKHPYTQGLMGSLPLTGEGRKKRLTNIEGMPPDLLDKPSSCPYSPRCQYVLDQCWEMNPILKTVGPEHQIACWLDEIDYKKKNNAIF